MMINKHIALAILITLLGMSSLAHARKTELLEPSPINVPEGAALVSIDKAIDGALLQNGWYKSKILSEEPRIDEITYSIRSHKIYMKMERTQSLITLTYIDSENLNYVAKKNVRYIHPKYNVWTQALADQIRKNLELGDGFSIESVKVSSAQIGNPPPTEPFSNFSSFKLENVTLAEKFQSNEGSVRAKDNLNSNLQKVMAERFAGWSKAGSGKVLIIKPHISAIRFVGTASRVWVGAMAGRSWIYVSVTFVDGETGAVVASPELYRVAEKVNGFTVSRADYKMIEDMAADIEAYINNNYKLAVGGGTVVPANIKAEIQ